MDISSSVVLTVKLPATAFGPAELFWRGWRRRVCARAPARLRAARATLRIAAMAGEQWIARTRRAARCCSPPPPPTPRSRTSSSPRWRRLLWRRGGALRRRANAEHGEGLLLTHVAAPTGGGARGGDQQHCAAELLRAAWNRLECIQCCAARSRHVCWLMAGKRGVHSVCRARAASAHLRGARVCVRGRGSWRGCVAVCQ